jgi:cytochrome c
MKVLRTLALMSALLGGDGSAIAAAIHDAAKTGDVVAIEAAIASGSHPDESDGSATPLYYAVTKGHFGAVELLVARGADVNLVTKWGPPVINAAWNGDADILKLLLAKGADPNGSYKTETALHLAAQKGQLECTIILVEAGADVNALTKFREPPIHFAKKGGHEEVAQYLLTHGYIVPNVPSVAAKLPTADINRGQRLFVKECSRCHDAGPEQRKFRGPPLWNVLGRPLAALEGFKYSTAIKQRGGVWDYDALNSFLFDPSRVLPGTDMGSNGLQSDLDRLDLIAFLRTRGDNPL